MPNVESLATAHMNTQSFIAVISRRHQLALPAMRIGETTVVDEGEDRHGTAEIRAWQTGAASKYTYTTEITSTQALGPERYLPPATSRGTSPAASPT